MPPAPGPIRSWEQYSAAKLQYQDTYDVYFEVRPDAPFSAPVACVAARYVDWRRPLLPPGPLPARILGIGCPVGTRHVPPLQHTHTHMHTLPHSLTCPPIQDGYVTCDLELDSPILLETGGREQLILPGPCGHQHTLIISMHISPRVSRPRIIVHVLVSSAPHRTVNVYVSYNRAHLCTFAGPPVVQPVVQPEVQPEVQPYAPMHVCRSTRSTMRCLRTSRRSAPPAVAARTLCAAVRRAKTTGSAGSVRRGWYALCVLCLRGIYPRVQSELFALFRKLCTRTRVRGVSLVCLMHSMIFTHVGGCYTHSVVCDSCVGRFTHSMNFHA